MMSCRRLAIVDLCPIAAKRYCVASCAQASIDLNLTAPIEEYLEFKVEARKEKAKVKEMQSIIKKLKKDKSFVEV